MGPVALFDKSFLQSLSVDESVWFDHYFTGLFTPLFFVETLADLEKEDLRDGRTVEDEVRIIADKTPELSSAVNVHHLTLCEGELRGMQVRMERRPVISGGRSAIAAGKKGVVFDVGPEAEALNRWQNAEFYEVERRFAKDWRAGLAAPFSPPGEDYLRWHRDGLAECRSLQAVYQFARRIIAEVNSAPHERMGFVFEVLGLRRDLDRLACRYSMSGAPSLAQYAPFTAHVLTVEVFFRFALERGFISRERASNRVDIAYLHYLPFCHIFVSGDRLHRMTVPLFLSENQQFVWAGDLKADLTRIDARNKALPPDVQETGIMNFAPKPPVDGAFLTSEIWDKVMAPSWRNPPRSSLVRERHADLVARMKLLDVSARSEKSGPEFSLDEADVVLVKRRNHMRKGHWYQLPKGFVG